MLFSYTLVMLGGGGFRILTFSYRNLVGLGKKGPNYALTSFLNDPYSKGRVPNKKCPKKWKKSKRGGGSAPEIKKSTIQNVDFFTSKENLWSLKLALLVLK